MLRFAVHDTAALGPDCTLVGAHLLGRDDVAIAGKVELGDDGIITCTKRDAEAAAVALLYDAGPMGRLTLQTCLLPDREEPYILTVELARHRIKQFLSRGEEWQMFDLSDEHPSVRQWEKARRRMTAAFKEQDLARAEAAGRSALIAGIDAGERLAVAHGQVLLHRRFGNRPASSTTLGVRVWPGRESAALQEVIERDFDVLQLPLTWAELEVEEGRYRWGPLDRWMAWAQDQGKPILAGPLLDFSRDSVPKWLHVWQHDYDTCRDLAYDHVQRVVHRYKSAVGIWNLCSGLNVNDNFEFTLDQSIDLTRMASLIVRQARPGARTMVELAQPFGVHAAVNRNSTNPMAFIDRLGYDGLRLDSVGVQLLFGEHTAGRSTRDLMQISTLLDRFVNIDTPVMVTAMAVPSAEIDVRGGNWHHPWSPEVQARWIHHVCAIALSKPYIEAVFWGECFDHGGSSLPTSGLIDESGRVRPALKEVIGFRRRLRKPLGPFRLPVRGEKDASKPAQS